MGTVKGDVIAAKVKISRPYKDENGNIVIRVWGYIPQQADIYNTIWNRETVVEKIHEHLKNNHNLTLWREINSGRDSETGKMIDEKAFLQSLLKI
jgi:CRISPR-associated protein Cmr1